MSNPLLDTSSLPRFADITPEHVVPALEQLIATQRSKLEKLLATTTEPDFDSLVAPLEEMEHELSRVWSPVSHLQGVLGSREWRDAYNEALPILTDYGTELSQNAHLQQAYARVDSAFPDDAPEARRSAVAQALRDFRLAGVDLPDEDKSRFKEIMQTLAATQADFDHNIQDASDAWTLHFSAVEGLAGLPAQALERAAAEAAKCDREGWLLTLDFPTYHAVMTHAENRGLRETLYHAWVTRASDQGANAQWDNSSNIDKILALRHEAANLVGFPNFAGYSLATKMAETPDQVVDFLRELAAHSRAAAGAELDELRELAGMAIEPWDLGFYLEKLKQEKFSFSNEELRQYFPVATVIDGLFDLASNLYGVTFKRDDSVITWHATRYVTAAATSSADFIRTCSHVAANVRAPGSMTASTART
jgi:oligopeptidase A